MTLPSTHMEIHIVLQTRQNTESDSDDVIQMEPEIVFLIRSQQTLLIHRAHFSSKATGPIPILFLNYQQSLLFVFLAIQLLYSVSHFILQDQSVSLSKSPIWPISPSYLEVSAQIQLSFRKLPWTLQEEVGTSSAVHAAFLACLYYGTNTLHCRFLFVYFPTQSIPNMAHSARHMEKHRKYLLRTR